MVYDLNIPWSPTTSHQDLQRTIAFSESLGYTTLALNQILSSPLPSQIVNTLPSTSDFTLSSKSTLLHRCTLILHDPTQNHRLPALALHYHLLALRPTTEKAFLAACITLDSHSLISLDLTVRYTFHFKPKPLMTAVNRGIFFEICYAQIVDADANKRTNFISNVMAIVRATKGRGLVLSSEAKGVLGLRGVADVVNLLGVWGLSRERAVEGCRENPRGVVVNEGIKRRGFRGVVDVVYGGMPESSSFAAEHGKEKSITTPKIEKKGTGNNSAKRKAEDKVTPQSTPQLSKRAQKKARIAALQAENETSSSPSTPSKAPMPTRHLDTPISDVTKESNG
jgi:ribonuclease P/MRP protein subunit RPP1